MSGAAPLSVTKKDVEAAYSRIRKRVRKTPVLEVSAGTFGVGRALSLKLEYMQHAGSFKTRGAFNTLLSHDIPSAGVAAASGGNHGVAVAYAAKELQLHARIFVPEIASAAKIAAIRSHGADIVISGARYADAQVACDAFVAETGALRIHPFDADDTIAGQGTVALEWLDQLEQMERGATLDTLLIACGGGGLAAGMAAYVFGSRVKIVAVEPEGSCALHTALERGAPVDVNVESVAADSLGAKNVGARVLEIAKRAIERVVLVTDVAITNAQRALFRECRIATEPGGAAALAAIMSGAYDAREGERVGVLVCGANVDLEKLDAIVRA